MITLEGHDEVIVRVLRDSVLAPSHEETRLLTRACMFLDELLPLLLLLL